LFDDEVDDGIDDEVDELCVLDIWDLKIHH
jgi:hypothetical protein